MTREEFKIYAHGQFAMMNVEGTINKSDMKTYVEGALLGFDTLKKLDHKHTEPHKVPLNKFYKEDLES